MQQLNELRKQMAEKYENCDQKEKPQVKLCEHCQQDIYCNQICPNSGLFHNDNKMKIEKNIITSAQLISAKAALRIKWQEARVKKVLINNKTIRKFQSSIANANTKNKQNVQIYGIMYGTYDDENKHMYIHNILEQKKTSNMKEDTAQDKFAMSLGLQRVGIILSHPPRNKDDYIISGKEIMLSAKEQSRFGDHCVLVTVSYDAKTRDAEICSWQISEQCVNLYRTGAFLEINHKKNDKCLITSEPLEISNSCSMEKSSIVDTHWFFAPIAIGQFESSIIKN